MRDVRESTNALKKTKKGEQKSDNPITATLHINMQPDISYPVLIKVSKIQLQTTIITTVTNILHCYTTLFKCMQPSMKI